VVEEAWLDEQAVLRPIPDRLLADAAGATVDMSNVIDLAAIRAKGAIVSHRGLDEYELDE
jgi:hypothetical protein